MHAVYKTNSTWSITEMIADLTKLITGVTDIQTLSASCDKTQTSIVANTVPADWTLYDTAPTNPSSCTGMQIISRQGSQDSLMKYVGLLAYSGANLTWATYTSWNNVTHTGVDQGGQWPSGYTIGYTTSVPAIIYMWVYPSYILLLGNQNSSWKHLQGAFELNRAENKTYSNFWDEANGKSICFICSQMSGSSSFFGPLPRLKSPYNTGESVSEWVQAFKPFDLPYLQRNTNETNNGVLLIPWIAKTYNYGAYLGTINDIKFVNGTSVYTMNNLDEFTYSGKTYQVLVGASYYFAVPKE